MPEARLTRITITGSSVNSDNDSSNREEEPGWALRWLVATPSTKGSNPARLLFIDTATKKLKRRMKKARAPKDSGPFHNAGTTTPALALASPPPVLALVQPRRGL